MAREISIAGSYYGKGDDTIIMWIMGLKRDPSYCFTLTAEQAAKLIDELTVALHRSGLEYVNKS